MHPWIREAEGRNMVLLGAGASAPAGLPTSAQLVAALMETRGAPWLNSMIEFIDRRIAQSGRPSNIEQLYAAAVDYLYRDDEPVSMFVEKWAEPEPAPSLEEAIPAAERARFMAGFIPHKVLSCIDKLSIGAAKNTDYLLPVFSPSVASIVTLNYDLLLEAAAKRHGYSLLDGAADWDGTYQWPVTMKRPEFLKIHGSIDWRVGLDRSAALRGSTDFITRNRNALERGKTSLGGPGTTIRADAAVIFGAGNKLTSSFVFPALINRFRDSLHEANTLTIVGYSFSDAHVNEAVHRWLQLNPEARLIVLDIRQLEDPSFTIYRELVEFATPEEPAGIFAHMRRETQNRITYIPGSAETTLGQVLGTTGLTEEVRL